MDIVKKTQAKKNSKLKQNLEKNSSEIWKKLKNRQLQLSSDGGIFLQTLKFSPSLPMWSIFGTVNLKVQYRYFTVSIFLPITQISWSNFAEIGKWSKGAHGAKFYRFNSLDSTYKTQGAFGEKTQNSRENQKKLKAKSKKKNQKPQTPVELSCQKNVQK